MSKKWIQKSRIMKGALSKQLCIPESEDIPLGLLKKIKETPTGTIITNPTKRGKRHYKVTKLMKRRASLAITLKGFKR